MKHTARGTKHEARLLVMVMIAVCSSAALAMPTQDELKKAQPLVVELIADDLAAYKAKSKKAEEIGDVSVKYAQMASTDAAKFLLLRGAISYYVRGEVYDKAAEAVELMKANVKDVPAEVIAEIISKVTIRATTKNATRLFELYRLATTQAAAEKDIVMLRAMLKVNPDSQQITHNLAEALAISGDWDAALKEFAKLKDQTAQMAKGEQDGSAKNATLGEFWWAYKPTYENAEATFKIRAVFYYRKALAADEITGHKKNIVERRLKEYAEVFKMHASGIHRKGPADGSIGGLKKVEKRLERANCQDSVSITTPAVVDETELTPKSVAGGRERKTWQEKGNAATPDADLAKSPCLVPLASCSVPLASGSMPRPWAWVAVAVLIVAGVAALFFCRGFGRHHRRCH